jgi:hypothetical protein
VTPGQCSAGKVIKTNSARLAAIPLALLLRIVMAVPDYIRAATACTYDTIRPTVLAYNLKALAFI